LSFHIQKASPAIMITATRGPTTAPAIQAWLVVEDCVEFDAGDVAEVGVEVNDALELDGKGDWAVED
jgi:hypothetical protein